MQQLFIRVVNRHGGIPLIKGGKRRYLREEHIDGGVILLHHDSVKPLGQGILFPALTEITGHLYVCITVQFEQDIQVTPQQVAFLRFPEVKLLNAGVLPRGICRHLLRKEINDPIRFI